MYVKTVRPAIPTKASDIRYQSTILEEHEDFIDFQQPPPMTKAPTAMDTYTWFTSLN